MSNLDSKSVRAIDRSGMIDRVLATPEYLRGAWKAASRVPLEIETARLQQIVHAGMGGSAIAGDVVRCLTYGRLPVPLSVCRTYRLPNLFSDRSLLLACSYSGNTEETLSAFHEARQAGARIIAITSGGRLQELAHQFRLPLFTLPGGFPPRSALAFLTAPLLAVLSACGWLPEADSAVAEAAGLLDKLKTEYSPEAADERNPAKSLANRLHGKIPVTYASQDNFEGVACRWKGQFCENSEVLAFWNTFPELNHNEIVGWGLRPELDRRFQTIFLRDRDDHERVQRRMDITRRIIEKSSNEVIEVWSQGESRLARLFSTIFLGDMASVYLAVLNGVDPTPVHSIDFLKDSLSK